ncbi:hypothetical protein CWB96_17835 [Pseudoalteromonas citrea]|uniref:HTH cro/C1-type domain-containing protein n=1 Tax=Pseudoalteromonas citrea TaxID=43655 RepID=A0A5S3XKB7_9GAMM|nr:helix-turn-helix transcriptional regulator [Pseudoalteromonas citrea]TMP42277.1 hypothetical protein CWB97_12185 [Pseudoalteromonas citrea]TMP55151.1 hypothetical protein CWB96_17835 [Pseudoalteromonas citrea]
MLDGSDLKSVRKNAGISQTDMAKKLDCDRRTIINYEQGVCEPKTSQLFSWLSACNIDLKPLASQLQHFKESIFVLFALPMISAATSSNIYSFIVLLCIMYAVVRKNINIAQISTLLFVIYNFEYRIITLLKTILVEHNYSAISIATIHYSFQILMATFSLVIFSKRIKISKYILNKMKVSPTIADQVLPWIYIYLLTLAIISAIEYGLNYKLNFKHLAFVYDYYEQLNYVAMLSIICLLFTMIVRHEKELKNGNSQC